MDAVTNLVLAGIDGSVLTDAVCDYAAWIANRLEAPLKLLHTIDHHHETAPTVDLTGNIGVDSRDHLLEEVTAVEQHWSKSRLQQGKLLLKAAKERVMQAGVAEPLTNQRHGSLVEALMELEDQIRVLVIGVRGKAHEHQTGRIGAKLEAIIRSLHRPILVVNGAFKAPQNAMIAYDGSRESEKALDLVATSALFRGLRCHLVSVAPDDGRNALLTAAANRLRQAKGKDTELIVTQLKGQPEQGLCAYQAEQAIDLTIMGAFRHSRIHDLVLGSFTAKMLAKAKTPLLLLR
jgi:nucleotide-binding universal stress UspA family protein